jgi:uncharacterized protein (DUF58 family)
MEPLIPPALRARLGEFRLAARQAHGGQGYGQHASRSRGAGLEFAQYRAYEPGDELRQIDWKLYARSDKFFVREAERDSPLTAWVVLDTTASMGQRDGARAGWTRLDAARVLAAAVLELALRQGDRFGLLAIGGDGLRLVPASHGPRQRDRCHLELRGLRPGGAWPAEAQCRPAWERIHAGDLAVIFSDGFDEGVLALAERLAAARRDICFVQVLTGEERDFPFRGGRRFVDPESGAMLLADGEAARADFLEKFAAAQAALSARLAAAGIRQARWHLDEALHLPLQRLFPARALRGAAEAP